MTSENHRRNQFGFLYPSSIVGVGSPDELKSFFEAISFISKDPRSDFPYTFRLLQKPVVGRDMLQLFDEARILLVRFQEVPTTNAVLQALNLTDGRAPKLKTGAETLAGVYARMFFVLAEDAPELVRLRMAKPDSGILERGSIRLGPIEPLIPSRFFQQLPASAFDDADPPLWLRDEIFDEEFYRGKI